MGAPSSCRGCLRRLICKSHFLLVAYCELAKALPIEPIVNAVDASMQIRLHHDLLLSDGFGCGALIYDSHTRREEPLNFNFEREQKS